MSRELVNYIRSHEYIYNFLRDESHHYIYLYRDNNYIKVIKRLAKEKYHLRYVDKMEYLKNKMNSSFYKKEKRGGKR